MHTYLNGVLLLQDEKMRQKELWEQIKQRYTELDVALSSVHWACELSQFRADTAEVTRT